MSPHIALENGSTTVGTRSSLIFSQMVYSDVPLAVGIIGESSPTCQTPEHFVVKFLA